MTNDTEYLYIQLYASLQKNYIALKLFHGINVDAIIGLIGLIGFFSCLNSILLKILS